YGVDMRAWEALHSDRTRVPAAKFLLCSRCNRSRDCRFPRTLIAIVPASCGETHAFALRTYARPPSALLPPPARHPSGGAIRHQDAAEELDPVCICPDVHNRKPSHLRNTALSCAGLPNRFCRCPLRPAIRMTARLLQMREWGGPRRQPGELRQFKKQRKESPSL